jgi:hypothetical protein
MTSQPLRFVQFGSGRSVDVDAGHPVSPAPAVPSVRRPL